MCTRHAITASHVVRQDPAQARIGKIGVAPEDGAEVDSDATVSAKEDTSDYSEDGGDSDATVSAEEPNDQDEGDDSDSEYTEDGARKPGKGKTPPKRALSSNTTSEKPSKRVRAKGNDDGDDGTDVHQEEEGLGVGGAEAESSEDEDEDEDLDDSSAGEVEDSQWRELRAFLSSGTVSSTHEGV